VTRIVKRPGADAQLETYLRRLTFAGAAGGAGALQEKLRGPGSGVHHPGNPNPSSSEGEYPAEQTGALADSIMPVHLEGTRSGFGSVDGPPWTVALHFKPPGDGGRPFMDDAKHDRDIHRAMRDGIREEVKW